ncbi:hypothetical protein THAOC_30540, partial [Thalassiosira oceanica]
MALATDELGAMRQEARLNDPLPHADALQGQDRPRRDREMEHKAQTMDTSDDSTSSSSSVSPQNGVDGSDGAEGGSTRQGTSSSGCAEICPPVQNIPLVTQIKREDDQANA